MDVFKNFQNMNWFSLVGNLLSGGIITKMADTFSSDEAIYNELGIKNQNLVNWERQQAINNQNINFQKMMNEQNIQNAWDMFNATNSYNSPLAQMERYKAAGLNPNLIYGQQNTASSVSIPSMGTPDISSYNSSDPLGGIVNTLIQLPQVIQNMKQKSLINENLYQDSLIKRGQADYWANRAVNEGYKTSELLFNDEVWHNMKEKAFREQKMDDVVNAWFKSLMDSFETSGLKNTVYRHQAAYMETHAQFEALRKKYYEGFNGSKGLFDLEREFMDLRNRLKQIDIDYEDALKVGQIANPWLKGAASLLRGLFK